MRSRGFDQLWQRVETQRARLAFPYLQATLRTPPRGASELERLEFWLLTLSDEQYDTLSKTPSVVIRDDAPSSTGDAVADRWEREFWATRGT